MQRRTILFALGSTTMNSFSQVTSIIRVAALADGKVLVDGVPVSLSDLDARLKLLKAANGVVWYYRENPASEPRPEALRAIKAIFENRLPVSMSSKPDFSDVIDASGHSKPRVP